MDLQQLRYIIALAKDLNFKKAAQSVGISQPTLSQQIKKLEDELGKALFERSPHSVKLTAAGEKFLPRALAALEALKAGAEDLKEDDKELRGSLKIGFIPTIGPYLLPKVIQKLRKSAPLLQLELYEETTSVLLNSLKEGKFDLGLVALPIEDSGLVTKSLGSEEFKVAVSSKNPLARKSELSLRDIEGKPLLMLKEGHCFREQALDFCKRQGRHPQVTFEGSSLVSVLNLVAVSNDITLVPQLAISSSPHAGLRYIPLKNPKPIREIGLAWRMSMPLNRLQKFLIEIAMQTLRNFK